MYFIRGCLIAASYGLVFLGAAQAQTVNNGVTTVLPTADSQNANILTAQMVGLKTTQTIQSLSFYVTAASGNLILGLYDATGPSGGPGGLKATTASFAPKTGWNTAKVVTPVSLAAGNYWLAFLPSSNALGFVTQRPAPGYCRYYSYAFGALPARYSASPVNCSPQLWSLYATLTVASPVAGKCGLMNGLSTNAAPTSYSYPPLCAPGTPSAVSGSGPWAWTCNGSNGGANASCQAPVETILPRDSSASANWRSAGMLSVGGIPNRTAVCRTLSPLGGGRDDTANIQSAIDGCPLGQIVSLAAGAFTIAEGHFVLVNKGITLRGAGPGITTLTRTGGAQLGSFRPGSNPSPMVILGPVRFNNPQIATKLTIDGAAGRSSVQVASASGFAVGQTVRIDENSGGGWRPDVEGLGLIWAASDYRVVWQKHYPSQGIDDFSASGFPYQAGTAGCWFSNCDRPTNEYHRIAAISGNTITFDSPLTISYRVSHQAQLYYYQTPFTEKAGIEQLTVQYGDSDNIDFQWCAYCWARNVESTLWLGVGFGVNSCFRVELNQFYAHKPVWPVPGGGGYNISLANGSSEILIWNGISVLGNKVMVSRSSGAGSVTAYNYMDMGFISGSSGWQEVGLNNSHMVGSHHMLFEGNYSFNIDSDQTHGNSIYNTFFRNYTTGFRAKFTDYLKNVVVNDIAQQSTNGPLRTASVHAYGYWDSFVGNVFGAPGQMAGFIYGNANQGAGNWPPQIYMMGWNDLPQQIYDPTVIKTALIDGNYDFVKNQVVWAASDTAHKLPSSLFLFGKPAFFNLGRGYTWPWVNPTGAPLFYALPAKARFDAGTPFRQP